MTLLLSHLSCERCVSADGPTGIRDSLQLIVNVFSFYDYVYRSTVLLECKWILVPCYLSICIHEYNGTVVYENMSTILLEYI
jgi:hypothetical protein